MLQSIYKAGYPMFCILYIPTRTSCLTLVLLQTECHSNAIT